MAEPEKLSLIATVAASYLRRNSVGMDQISVVISSVTRALQEAATEIERGAVTEMRSPPETSEDGLHRHSLAARAVYYKDAFD